MQNNKKHDYLHQSEMFKATANLFLFTAIFPLLLDTLIGVCKHVAPILPPPTMADISNWTQSPFFSLLNTRFHD